MEFQSDGTFVYDMDLFGIKILFSESGQLVGIETGLHVTPECEADKLFNAAMDGIEAMILAQVAAGVDYMCHEFRQGITDAVQACADNF